MGAEKQAVGLCVDGAGLKVAVLSRKRGTVRIEGLLRDVLPNSLEEDYPEEESSPSPAEQAGEDAFGLAEPKEGAGVLEEEEEITNQSVLLRALGKFTLRKEYFAVNMPASRVYYYEFEEGPGSKKRDKIRKYLREELQSSYQIDLPLDAVDFLQTDDGRLLAVAHDHGLAVLDLVEEVKSFLHGPVTVALADTNEIALMNLVRASYSFSGQEVVAVVYIGEEFSRVLFMRGNDYLSFGGVVNEGRQSPRVLNALFSKILLEQDVSGMPDIDRFLLSGDCGDVDAQAFFARQFPDARVDYLVPPPLDSTGRRENEEDIASFAIPIGLAWKALETKNDIFYDTDFVPKHIRDRQNAYKLAWHGFLAIGLIGVAVFALVGQWEAQTRAIRNTQQSVQRLEASIAEVEADIASMGSLERLRDQISRYEEDIAFMDTLSQGAQKWSLMLRELALQAKGLQSVWFEHFSSKGNLVLLKGRSLYRSRIPKMSQRLGDAILQTVSPVEIRGTDIHEFELGYLFSKDGAEALGKK